MDGSVCLSFLLVLSLNLFLDSNSCGLLWGPLRSVQKTIQKVEQKVCTVFVCRCCVTFQNLFFFIPGQKGWQVTLDIYYYNYNSWEEPPFPVPTTIVHQYNLVQSELKRRDGNGFIRSMVFFVTYYIVESHLWTTICFYIVIVNLW